jgi:hypothetical protein
MNIRVIEKSKNKKWRSAEEKYKTQQLAESWEKLKAKYDSGKKLPLKANSNVEQQKPKPIVGPRGPTPYIPSHGDGIGTGVKKEIPVYTGTSMCGIAIMHKSCLQPVFSEQEAKDSAAMRR